MADLADVINVLVGQVAAVVYPQGSSQPSAVNLPVAVYAGWPDATTLDASMRALNAGLKADPAKLHVSIYPRAEERVSTRYQDRFVTLARNAATLTISHVGQVVTIGGTVSTPQNIAIVPAHGAPILYAVQPSDTLSIIASALSALIPGASSSGSTLTLPNGYQIVAARAGGTGTLLREMRRQTRSFQITVWANNDANRNALASVIDEALADIEFLLLPDGSGGRLLYQSSPVSDSREQVQIYRRDLFYTVEYGTTQSVNGFEVVTAETDNGVMLPNGDIQPVSTTYQ